MGCLVYLVSIIVGCLGGSVLKVDLPGMVKKKRVTSCFVSKVMIGGSLCVSGPCILQISCGNISNLS